VPALLFAAFVVVPLLELYVIIQVGQVIGAPATLLAVVALSAAGAVLVKREGLRAWQRFRWALQEGRLPAREVVDGALLLVGGALMLTPGFVTDGVGLLLLLPPSRAVVNRILRNRTRAAFGLPPRRAGDQGRRPAAGRRPDEAAYDVEVVHVERDEPQHPPREVDPGSTDPAAPPPDGDRRRSD
jgi:UPF0716 protein FxsA